MSRVHQFLKNLDSLGSRKKESYHELSSISTAKHTDSNQSETQPESSDRRTKPHFSSFGSPKLKERPKNATQLIYGTSHVPGPLPLPVQTHKRNKARPPVFSKTCVSGIE